MKLGPCLKISDLTADLTGPGTWDPDTGVFTCTFGSNGTCGGGDEEYASQLVLTVNGCGKLKITGSGTGYKYGTGVTGLSAVGGHFFDTIMLMHSPGGGPMEDTCSVGALVGTPEGVAEFACGDYVVIYFSRPSGVNLGEVTCTVTVEVDTP